MKSYGSITYKYLRVQKKRTILTIIGIMLSTALIVSIGLMFVGIRNVAIRNIIKTVGDYHAVFLNVDGSKVNKITNNVEVSQAGIVGREATGLIKETKEVQQGNHYEGQKNKYLIIQSYDKNALKMLPITLKEGRMPKKPDEIVLDAWCLDYFDDKPKVGDTIKINIGIRKESPDSDKVLDVDGLNQNLVTSTSEVFEKTGERQFKIVGLMELPNRLEGVANGITFLDKVSSSGRFNVFVKMSSVKNVHQRIDNIAKKIGHKFAEQPEGYSKYDLKYNEDLLTLYAQNMNTGMDNSIVYVFIFMTVLIMVCTAAVIYNAFNISVLERIPQFGILRCVGATPKQISRIILKEAGMYSIIGIPLGVVLGRLMISGVLYLVGLLRFDYFKNIKIDLSIGVLTVSIILSVLTIYISAFVPALKAGKVSPIEAVRNTKLIKKEKLNKIRKGKLAALIFKIEGQLAYKNLRRNKSRFRITIFSMVISIILFIVFGSFVDDIYKMDIINQVKGADMYFGYNDIYPEDNQPFEESLLKEIKDLPDVDKVYKQMQDGFNLISDRNKVNMKTLKPFDANAYYTKGSKIELMNSTLFCYGDDGLEELKKHIKEGSIDKNTLNKEKGVIIINTVKAYDQKNRRRALLNIVDYHVGDYIEVSNQDNGIENGNIQRLKVEAVLDKGILGKEYNENPGIIAIVTEDVYKSITGNNNYSGVFIKLKQGAYRDVVVKYFKNKTANGKYQFVDYSELEEEERNQSLTMGIFLYGFVAVIALIGCLNIINTISTGILLRKRELAMLKAVGMTFGGLIKLIGLEGVLYGIIAAFYGSAIGTVLSYILYRFVINITEFQWEMPWRNIIIATAGAMIIAIISGFMPIRKISENNIMEDLRMEE